MVKLLTVIFSVILYATADASNYCRCKMALWKQKTVTLPSMKRGCHLVTSKHTSASLTINENYDRDVQLDTETWLNRPDDMPAHIKSSMFGCSLTVPITDGSLNLGTWQGIWLCEHRDSASSRHIVVTMTGV
eukprot:jgi/Mesen1/3082/ME000183S02137